MSHVLYRKYRPQKFSEVINQTTVKKILKNAVREGRISHAYLFTGPRGVGKTTIARIMAKAVNCEQQTDGEPCTECENCMQIAQGRFLDLFEIDAASYTGVDNIREIIDHVKFSPSRGRYKVFIIDEVHMLSKAAFNALLKTLEEPPAHAIFILATTEIHKVPPTVISRTQRFDFKAVSQKDILQLLAMVLKDEGKSAPLEAQTLIAEASGGSFRDALSILDQVMSTSDDLVTLELVEDILGVTRMEVSQKFLGFLLTGDAKPAVEMAKSLSFAGKDMAQFIKNFLDYLRLVLFVKLGILKNFDLGLATEEAEKLQVQASGVSSTRLLEIIKNMLGAYRETRTSPVQELPLLVAVLALSTPEAEKSAVSVAEAKREKPAPAASKDANLAVIIEKWPQVLAKVKEYNHSLISSLRVARLVRMDGEELVMAFSYNFHKEAIEARKNRIIIEQVLRDVFSRDLKVRAVLERETETAITRESSAKGNVSDKSEGDLLQEAIKIMGKDNHE